MGILDKIIQAQREERMFDEEDPTLLFAYQCLNQTKQQQVRQIQYLESLSLRDALLRVGVSIGATCARKTEE